MLKHGWSIICEKVINDSASNNISLISCVEQINSTVLPAILPFLTIVSYWYKEDPSKIKTEILELKMCVKDPNNKEQVLFEDKINVEKPRQRIMAVLGSYPFAHAGTYYIAVQAKQNNKWATVAELPIQVLYKPDLGTNIIKKDN